MLKVWDQGASMITWQGPSFGLKMVYVLVVFSHDRMREFFGVLFIRAAAAKSLQSCLTLCDPRDSSPPGFPIPGILQARTLEWVAIFFSNAWKWKVKVKSLNSVRLLVTPWTAAYQAPPSMGFFRQEYWSWVPLPSPFIRALIPFIRALSSWPDYLPKPHLLILSHCRLRFIYINLSWELLW